MTTDERFDEVISRLAAIDSYLLQFRTEVTGRLEVIENRLAAQTAMFNVIDSQYRDIM